MSYNTFTPIVTNGLVLYLDAANTKSYPGTGTSWLDLSKNGGVGTLTNGPIFNTSNGGNIVFDGIDESSIQSNVSAAVTTNSFSIEVWCSPTATITVFSETMAGLGVACCSGHRNVIYPENNGVNYGAGISVGTNGINILLHKNGAVTTPLTLSKTLSNTTHTNIVLVYNNKIPSLYLDGQFIKSGLSDSTTVYSSPYYVGGYVYGNFAGSVAMVKHYNRPLSASEVLQNYNATKFRFQ